MVARSWLVLVVGSLAVGLGCSVPAEDAIGQEDGATNEVVTEGQLSGRALPDRTVSLTFDDGPGGRTAELADFLGDRGIEATFFINGVSVPGHEDAIARIVARGHLLANHTQRHRSLPSLSAAEIVQEVSETDAIIAAAQPDGPWILRAPFGAWDGAVAAALNASAMTKYVGSVFWDEGGALTDDSAADWDCWGKGVSVARCGELYLAEIRAKGRGIVLMHDVHAKTVEMVETVIVPALLAEGFTFAPLVDVPSVKQALGGGGAPRECESATLGRVVAEDVCVQSRTSESWFRCAGGEWIASDGPADAKCTERFPLD